MPPPTELPSHYRILHSLSRFLLQHPFSQFLSTQNITPELLSTPVNRPNTLRQKLYYVSPFVPSATISEDSCSHTLTSRSTHLIGSRTRGFIPCI